MKNNLKIAVLGGDRRQRYAAQYLSDKGYAPFLWGVDGDGEGLVTCTDMAEAVSDAFAVLLPLPVSTDGKTLHAPSLAAEDRPTWQSLLAQLSPTTHIIGGRFPQSLRESAMRAGFSVYDYFESEAFQIRNAYTTAEAALSIAMNHLAKNISESRIAITGYGRISRQLSELLLCLGASVTVAARKESDLAWATVRGCEVIRLPQQGSAPLALAHGFDVIFNTVPTWLFDRAFLEQADKTTLYVELASAPGGIDVCAARELVCNVCWAMSLPGKYAPISAGELIGACVEEYCRGEGSI